MSWAILCPSDVRLEATLLIVADLGCGSAHKLVSTIWARYKDTRFLQIPVRGSSDGV